MTSYNDGKWHGWNGGECPVHPKTEVETVTKNCGLQKQVEAGMFGWNVGHPNPILAFKVTKEHKEPREFWIAMNYDGNLLNIRQEKPEDMHGFFKVREVT